MNSPPLAIDLFCGLGGWSEGLIAEGWRVIGYDIEAHQYGDQKYPGELIIQDVLSLHGRECKDAYLIVASPPCQFFSYVAMPWSREKALAAAVRADPGRLEKELALFKACFRIQREASEAAGRYIPLVAENVRGAQKWVGKARWNFGSYYLWGDVPALMPIPSQRRQKSAISCAPRNFSERIAATPEEAHQLHYRLPPKQEDIRSIRDFSGFKSQGMNWSDQTKRGQDFTRLAGEHCGLKGIPHKPTGHWTNPKENGCENDQTMNRPGYHVQTTAESSGAISTNSTPLNAPACQSRNGKETLIQEGVKQPGISGKRTNGKGDKWFQDGAARSGSKSNPRKAASAMIAKIPFPLSSWIAKTMKPRGEL